MDIINVLPDHILAEIFGFLSPRMIKCSSLVCKRWDDIISTSSELMRNFHLKVYDLEGQFYCNYYKASVFKGAMEIQRKHQSAIVTKLDVTLDVLLRHNLQSIYLTHCKGIKLSIFIKAINSLPSLKVIDADRQTFIDDVSKSISLFNQISTNVEQLKCILEIIHLFACCTVKKLKLSNEKPIDENRKSLVIDFLKRQKNLEDLDLYEESLSEFFNMPEFLELKFQNLKVLKHNRCTEPFKYYESFIMFLNQHKSSLTSLKVSFCTDPDFGLELIHKFALENIVNLKHIHMIYFSFEFNELTDLKELPAATEITKNLESLTLRALSDDMDINKRFFNMLPNLKYLNFKSIEGDYENELLQCISDRCVKIESLKMFGVYSDLPDTIKFPNLKELTVEMCDGEDLANFINRHSQTLERIIVENFNDYFSRSIANEILNCSKLNYLVLNFDRFYYASLKLIAEISLKTKPFTLKVRNLFPTKTHIFKFPDDGAIWDDEEI